MKKPVILAAAVALAFSLSACGSGSGSGTSTDADAGTGGQADQGIAGQGGAATRTFPGASGKVAAVSGKTAQVQDSDSQTAVTWTASTSFTREQAVSKSAVKVGSCVMAMPVMPAMPARGSGASDGSSDSGGSGEVAAATVRIISTSGDCTDGFGGRRPGAGAPSGMPSGAPSGMPSGAPGGRGPGGGMRIAVGEVTAVSGSGFTVKSSMGGQASTVKVTTSSKTTYTANVKASADAVKVGLCMSAQGKADSTGAVTARRVTLSKATNGTCTGGFGGGMPAGAPAGAAGTGNA